MKSCTNCANCCPKGGYPCSRWEMLCDDISEIELASNCNDYKAVTEEPEDDDRIYSPYEVYSIRELF